MYNDFLYHHGIKGQHWGVRRFQNDDGSLTDAGRKRYYSSDVDGANKNLSNAKADYKKAVGNYYKTTGGGMIYNQKATKDLTDSAKKLNWAKEDLKDEKVKTKLNAETKVSKRRTALEEEYKKKGMTDEEAAVAAYKREKTEKILAATLGVTVAAAAAYGAYKYHDYAFDKVIPAGTSIQNISGFANRGVEDAFYASINDKDNIIYRGFYGDDRLRNTGKAFESKFQAVNKAKIASDKHATEVLGNLIKNDSQFANNVQQLIQVNGIYDVARAPLYNKALESLHKGKVDNNVYRAVNANLVDRSKLGTNVKNKFYDELKKYGYDAISDTNDKRISFFKSSEGYNSKAPIIVFNGADKFVSKGSRELLPDEIKENYSKAMSMVTSDANIEAGSRALGSLGLYGGVLGTGYVARRTISRRQQDKIVSQYRKEHPNSELSYKEIIRNYQARK